MFSFVSLFQLSRFDKELNHLKMNFSCKWKKKIEAIKAIKVFGAKANKKIALVQQHDEKDVEWVYAIDLEAN